MEYPKNGKRKEGLDSQDVICEEESRRMNVRRNKQGWVILASQFSFSDQWKEGRDVENYIESCLLELNFRVFILMIWKRKNSKVIQGETMWTLIKGREVIEVKYRRQWTTAKFIIFWFTPLCFEDTNYKSSINCTNKYSVKFVLLQLWI